jgi:hypothetical protein
LKWPPAEFWAATPAEFFAAVAGWNRSQRGGPEPMTRAEFEALEDRYLKRGQ